MSSKRNQLRNVNFLATSVFFIISLVLTLLSPQAFAGELRNRTIIIGDSKASATTTHRFNLETVDATTIGSIRFQYCSNSPLTIDPCVAPAGLNVSGSTITAQSGVTGFSISPATTANELVITRVPGAVAAGPLSYTFDSVVNPSTIDAVNYVRISVYDNVNGTGTILDSGSVVFVVEDLFDIDAYVPPYLTFCVAVTVSLNCSSTSGFLGDFGEFSTTAPVTETTQMSAATNDSSGYNIFMDGQTLTSGANIIPALATQSGSVAGQSQFGINLRANTVPVAGADPENGVAASGSAAATYNTANQFRFVSGDRIAGSSISTGYNKYTVTYLINVSAAQMPGVYATTLTYTAVASF